jgi:hypothetical protein
LRRCLHKAVRVEALVCDLLLLFLLDNTLSFLSDFPFSIGAG